MAEFPNLTKKMMDTIMSGNDEVGAAPVRGSTHRRHKPLHRWRCVQVTVLKLNNGTTLYVPADSPPAFFDDGFGKSVEDGTATLEQAAEYAAKMGEPENTSGRQEEYEMVLNRYV